MSNYEERYSWLVFTLTCGNVEDNIYSIETKSTLPMNNHMYKISSQFDDAFTGPFENTIYDMMNEQLEEEYNE